MWNPAEPATVENPLPFWAWLRKEDPVWEVPNAGYFTVSRYVDLVEVSGYNKRLRMTRSFYIDSAGNVTISPCQTVRPRSKTFTISATGHNILCPRM